MILDKIMGECFSFRVEVYIGRGVVEDLNDEVSVDFLEFKCPLRRDGESDYCN